MVTIRYKKKTLIHKTLSEQGHKEQNRPLYELGDEYIFENDNLKVQKKSYYFQFLNTQTHLLERGWML